MLEKRKKALILGLQEFEQIVVAIKIESIILCKQVNITQKEDNIL